MFFDLIIPLLILPVILAPAVMLFAYRIRDAEKLIYAKETPYHHIMVFENGHIRTLRLGDGPDAGKQSQIDTRDPDLHLLEYTKLVFAGLLVNPEPRRILIIGLGGGVIPGTLRRHFPGCIIDVVDIDPDVVEAAERYFCFRPEGNTRVHISDGRLFVVRKIEENPEMKYDMIILDAFNMDSIPKHLITREFLMQVRDVLDPGGVVIANILSYTALFDSELRTYRDVFKNCHVFMGRQAKNAIFVAPGPEAGNLDSESAERDAETLQRRHCFSFGMKTVVQQFRPEYRLKRDARVLTDDYLLNASP